MNELLKKLKNDDKTDGSASDLPKYSSKKEKGIF